MGEKDCRGCHMRYDYHGCKDMVKKEMLYIAVEQTLLQCVLG